MDNPTLFISSTCYDLADIRQMLSQFIIEDLRLSVRRSDDATDSAFEIKDGLTAVECCLSNLDSSDWVIFILDRRYGPPLGQLGGHDYGDRSATHVEMDRALALNKHTLLLIRSQLLSLYESHSKNWFDKRLTEANFPALKPRWLMSANDLRLFELIRNYSATNRWRAPFTSFHDIKQLLWNQFRKYRYRSDVQDRILRNDVPHLLVRLVSWDRTPDGRTRIAARLANSTAHLAYNIRIRLGEKSDADVAETGPLPLNFLAAGQVLDAPLVLPGGSPRPGDRHRLTITYDFGAGQGVEDSYTISYILNDSCFILENFDKTYYVGDDGQARGPRIIFR